jgi:endonuclease/exonuclease/phosphatase (EEP) superfamily protein YafD
MLLRFLPLAILLSFSAQARRPLGYWTELVPEEQAHRSFGQAAELALDPASIKTLVWNIKKTQKAAWQPEFVRLSKGRDLVLLQEGIHNPRFTSTTQQLEKFRWDLAVSFVLRRPERAPTGSMIGATVAPSQVIVKQTEDFEPVVNTPKSTVFAKYPLAGSPQELLVISIHGINLTSLASFKRHMLQARAEIVRHAGPVLFAGDFNTRTQARTRYLVQLMRELSLDPVTFKNGDQRLAWKFTRNYLDHTFVRGLRVTAAEVLGDAMGSDHKPMVLDLALAP